MHLLIRLLWFSALWVFSVVGCNEVTIPPAPLVVTISTWLPQPGVFEGPALEGVEVCETGTTNCVVTNANGGATLLLPVDQEISYTLKKEGYAWMLHADVIPPDGVRARIGMAMDRSWAEAYENVMSQYPMGGTGGIGFFLTPSGFAGATFDLVEATGKGFYIDEEGNWNPDLAATASNGIGGFLEVAPGEFQIEVGGTAQGCVPDWGWPSDIKNSVRFPVQAGYITVARVTCAVP